jgi:hypothetical protein
MVWQHQAIRLKKRRHRYSMSLLIQEKQYENWHVLHVLHVLYVLYDRAYAGVFGLIASDPLLKFTKHFDKSNGIAY